MKNKCLKDNWYPGLTLNIFKGCEPPPDVNSWILSVDKRVKDEAWNDELSNWLGNGISYN